MNWEIALIVILLLIIISFDYNGVRNNIRIDTFWVNSTYHNPEAAHRLLKNTDTRINRFIEHLRDKFVNPGSGSSMQVGNRMDTITSSPMYSGDIMDMRDSVHNLEYIQQRIRQLLLYYDPGNLSEVNPLNVQGLTAYTESKNKISLCLRNKTPVNGKYELHDENLVMFVMLHELTHMMNNGWGHKEQYWRLFRFILHEAKDFGIYTPVDYKKHPVTYCGLYINHNPYYDPPR